MDQKDLIKDYYGKVLSHKNDLKTTACCVGETIPLHIRKLVSMVHDDVSSRFYGCGVPIPPALENCTVLDLGSGTGRDCFVLSKMVGDNGKVIGIDMTDEQINTAIQYVDYHKDVFGLKNKNVEFKKGFIECLDDAGIEDNSVDLVVSNCVINLSPDKEKVFAEIFRVLKPGGELYFSDVYSDRRLPTEFSQDKILLGECLGGALYTEDLRRLLFQNGCQDMRLMGNAEIAITNPEVKAKTGEAKFYSITVRAFKLPLEDKCEDYGQVATYKGTITDFEHAFTLDDHHHFIKNKPMLVCSNTADMLTQTRFAKHFQVTGDKSTHFGLFDCSTPTAATTANPSACC